MFKLWAKIITDGKIIRQITYGRDEKFEYSQFFNYLADICEALDAYSRLRQIRHRALYSARLCGTRRL